jgi:hypothetical protein
MYKERGKLREQRGEVRKKWKRGRGEGKRREEERSTKRPSKGGSEMIALEGNWPVPMPIVAVAHNPPKHTLSVAQYPANLYLFFDE